MNQQLKIKLVILDFDGTLVDSVPGIWKTVNIIAKKYKIKEITKEKVRESIGAGLDIFLERIFKDKIKNFDIKKLKDDYVNLYKKNYKYKLKLFKGVKEILKFLKKNKIKTVIISNKLKKFIRKSLRYLKIEKYITEIFGRGDLKKDKPHSYPILYVMNKYKVTRKQTIVVGDSYYDFKAARNAKVKFIYFILGYGDKEKILFEKPDFVIKNFIDIKKIISRIS